MPLLPTLSSSELTRLSRGVFGKLIVLALIAVPSIYAGLLTWSNLDATTSLDRVPAAIVNLDEPATVTDANGKKQTVPLGASSPANSSATTPRATSTGASRTRRRRRRGWRTARITPC